MSQENWARIDELHSQAETSEVPALVKLNWKFISSFFLVAVFLSVLFLLNSVVVTGTADATAEVMVSATAVQKQAYKLVYDLWVEPCLQGLMLSNSAYSQDYCELLNHNMQRAVDEGLLLTPADQMGLFNTHIAKVFSTWTQSPVDAIVALRLFNSQMGKGYWRDELRPSTEQIWSTIFNEAAVQSSRSLYANANVIGARIDMF